MTATWAFCGVYMKHVFEMFKNTRSNLAPEKFSQMFFLWLYSSKFYGDNPQPMEENIRNHAADPTPMTRPAFESQAAACVNHDTRGKLGSITAPVLLTTGSNDIFVPMECSQFLLKQIKNSTLEVFDGYAHVHHWEDLDRYNKVTSEFLLKNN
jgi:pimeloyl-ACP methyl ester carboxylesterase